MLHSKIVSDVGKERFYMIDSVKGLLLVVPQVHGFVDFGLVIVIHAMVLMAASDPHAAQPPGVSQRPLDGMYKLFMVPTFT